MLAIFQLGFAGGAPVGALGMGYLVALTGHGIAAIYPAAGMVVVLGFLSALRALAAHLRRSPQSIGHQANIGA